MPSITRLVFEPTWEWSGATIIAESITEIGIPVQLAGDEIGFGALHLGGEGGIVAQTNTGYTGKERSLGADGKVEGVFDGEEGGC